MMKEPKQVPEKAYPGRQFITKAEQDEEKERRRKAREEEKYDPELESWKKFDRKYAQLFSSSGTTHYNRRKAVMKEIFPDEGSELNEEEKKQYAIWLRKIPDSYREKLTQEDHDVREISGLMFVPQKVDRTDRNFILTAHYRYKAMNEKGKEEVNPMKITTQWVAGCFKKMYIKYLKAHPGVYFPVPKGASTDESAPNNLLVTDVLTTHRQRPGQDTCLYYSIASALHYIGLRQEANTVLNRAKEVIGIPSNEQIKAMTQMMKEVVPKIGLYSIHNTADSRGVRKSEFSLEEFCQARNQYPCVCFPVGNDGSENHTITVVDDLIFDSTQPNALKLCADSVHWICGQQGCLRIKSAYRFEHPYKTKKKNQLVRLLRKNW
jgi:hypothetical protein